MHGMYLALVHIYLFSTETLHVVVTVQLHRLQSLAQLERMQRDVSGFGTHLSL